MNSRKLFAVFLVLALSGSALAVQQQRLYRTVDDDGTDDTDPTAEGVVAIQQHSVFVEIIVEVQQDVTQIHQFAAVVGLVKKCKQVRNVFDNAVLWFNDQFLFGNKTNRTQNVTPAGAMGRNPDRIITTADLLDDNRNNGTGQWNDTTGSPEVAAVGNSSQPGYGGNEGGNPDRDGFIRARDFRERWGGCFIPNGFIHAIGSDDPFSTGNLGHYDVQTEVDNPANGATTEFDTANDLTDDNIGRVKNLIDLDRSCTGCLFEYVGTFYITDPNNHRWMVDKLVYPLNVGQLLGSGEDPTDCHFAGDIPTTYECGLESAERHRGRAEDDGVPDGQAYDDPTATDAGEPQGGENFDNHCNDGPDGECTGSSGDPTDRKGDERFKFTTKEPIYTVHLQVDPWNPDRQGFPDEAIWAYRQDGKLRVGMPYSENISDSASGQYCHDQATVAGASRFAPSTAKADAYEYDLLEGEGGPASTPPPEPAPANDPANTSGMDWAEYRRGPIGNTVECAIEYNFLVAIDFEAFDNTNPVSQSFALDRGDTGGNAGIWGNVTSQQEGEGENEIVRNFKEHGHGGADEADQAWQGNSHGHNARECNTVDEDLDGETCDEEAGPQHNHDAVSLDLFFSSTAPFFVTENPYWDHANATDTLVTAGTPPIVNDTCTDAPGLAENDYRRAAVQARIPLVCDVDAVDGFHLHDGTQTIANP